MYATPAAHPSFMKVNPDAAYIRNQRQCKHYFNFATAEFYRMHSNANLKLKHMGLASYLMALAHDSANQSVIMPIMTLAEHFGVTRQTIRRYIQALEAEGLVACMTNRRNNTTEFHLRASPTLRDAWAAEKNRRGKGESTAADESASTAAQANITPPSAEPATKTPKAPKVRQSQVGSGATVSPSEETPTEQPIIATPSETPSEPTPIDPEQAASFDFTTFGVRNKNPVIPDYIAEPVTTELRLIDPNHPTPYATSIASIFAYAEVLNQRKGMARTLFGDAAFHTAEVQAKIFAGYPTEKRVAEFAVLCCAWVEKREADEQMIQEAIAHAEAAVKAASDGFIPPSPRLPTGDALKRIVEHTLAGLKHAGKLGPVVCDVPLETLTDEILFMMHQKPKPNAKARSIESRWSMAQHLCITGEWRTPDAFWLNAAKAREAAWNKQKQAEQAKATTYSAWVDSGVDQNDEHHEQDCAV